MLAKIYKIDVSYCYLYYIIHPTPHVASVLHYLKSRPPRQLLFLTPKSFFHPDSPFFGHYFLQKQIKNKNNKRTTTNKKTPNSEEQHSFWNKFLHISGITIQVWRTFFSNTLPHLGMLLSLLQRKWAASDICWLICLFTGWQPQEKAPLENQSRKTLGLQSALEIRCKWIKKERFNSFSLSQRINASWHWKMFTKLFIYKNQD